MIMTHPGLPLGWGLSVWIFMVLIGSWAAVTASPGRWRTQTLNLAATPLLGKGIRVLTTSPWLLLGVKALLVALFLLVILAGLYGTPIAERNFATVLTWNLWWVGLILSVFFLGSAWCAVCPWDTLASWLVRRRLWRRAHPNNSLNLRVPKGLRNLWPALVLFIGLTWLELGFGVTLSPYATALMALFMVVLATVSLAIFERRAFCRYFCPVGRTVGFYAQLAPVELRPIDPHTCARCTTLDCYHGNETIEPCPTHLVMGRLRQNTYCTSCGNCTLSCPHQNVSWRLRPPSVEAIQDARPHWDEAWFMLALLALTAFHGITMMPFWEEWISTLARLMGDSGMLLWSFSIGLLASLLPPILLYTLAVYLTVHMTRTALPFRRAFAGLAFVSLPLAFAYHLAHNLNHLARESGDLGVVCTSPFGQDSQPLSMLEKYAGQMDLLISQDSLFALQAALMGFGFWIAVRVVQHRGQQLLATGQRLAGWRLSPMLVFVMGISGFHLWLLMQPMVMRM